jgi:molybdate transport system regulatory protein
LYLLLIRGKKLSCDNFRVKLQEVTKLKLKFKIWIEKDGEKVFGDGPLDILYRVERTGSLRQAAEEINMSYSLAWNLIKDLEKRLGFNLLKRKVGGKRGGGSEITEEARELMMKFKLFRGEADQSLSSLYTKIFEDKD